MPEIEIVNVVATANIKQQVNLKSISKHPVIMHSPETYGGRVAYIKTRSMKGKVSIFSSGKLISVGTKCPEQAQQDMNNAIEILVLQGSINPVNIYAKIRNIVAVQNIGTTIALEEMSLVINCIYEPEQFSGLILRQDNPKVTFLVFSSGKIVIAGCKSLDELDNAASKIVEIIDIFKLC